jgi:hypothetical protein
MHLFHRDTIDLFDIALVFGRQRICWMHIVLCLSHTSRLMDLVSSVRFTRVIFTNIYIYIKIHLNVCIYFYDIFSTSKKWFVSTKFKF